MNGTNNFLAESLFNSWKTTNRVSIYLIEIIEPDLWDEKIPDYPRKTIGTLATHLHNIRCMWIKAIDKEKLVSNRLTQPDSKIGTREEVLIALKESGEAIIKLLQMCIENDGKLPSRPAWLNFPNDVMHLLSYFVAHEAHHRGQIVMALRLLGRPLSRQASGELWQWTKRLKEAH